jgi:hypothetical protein
MADPIVSFYKEDDITELNDLNPEDHGTVIIGGSSETQIIHIWNDKGAVLGSTPMYNTKLKVVTEQLLDSGGSEEDGKELVEETWAVVQALTPTGDSLQLGNGVEYDIGQIDSDTFVEIEIRIDVPSDATPLTPDGDIRFKIAVLYELLEPPIV